MTEIAIGQTMDWYKVVSNYGHIAVIRVKVVCGLVFDFRRRAERPVSR